jgi:FkbM family methyltransferase
LIDNLIRNNLQDVVIPCSVALDAETGFSHFNYDSANAGTSNSQVSAGSGAVLHTHGSEIAELKYTTTIDRLMDAGRIAAPHHIKIDVDGNEYRILQGMVALLGSSAAPLTIQVEMNEPHSKSIHDFLQAQGYTLSHTHLTRSAARRMQDSAQPPDSGCNAIFRRSRE